MYAADEIYTDADGVFGPNDDTYWEHQMRDEPEREDEPEGPEHVFVYGILLTDAQQAALLQQHRLCFPSFGTVMPDDSSMVWGGLVKLGDGEWWDGAAEHLARYDACEGCDPTDPTGGERGYYRRKLVTVLVNVDDEGGTPVDAWVYEMREEHRGDNPNRFPRGDLRDRMRCQYDRLGMPPAAYAQLGGEQA